VKKPLLYTMWGVSVGGWAVIAGTMLAWQYVCDRIDEAFASF
jgi:hypothetical protein